jgi:integrase/recombinase XerD
MNIPSIQIFVRHKRGCKYEGDETCKRCNCRKSLRWTQDGKQFRRGAKTRSWAEAEEVKRRLEDQLSGAPPSKPSAESEHTISEAIEVFIQDKRNQGITDKVIGKYTRELSRLLEFCESRSVFTVRGLTLELLTGYVATWLEIYPASLTRSKVRERLRSFLRFCYQSEWLTRIPQLSKIQVDQAPTLPLTAEEYTRLLDTTFATFADDPDKVARIHALIQLMRWSGLAIRDALTLRRDEIIYDPGKKLHRIVTSRQKTGTHVSVPIPPDVAAELLAVLNGHPTYVFWSGNGMEESATKNMAKFIARLFDDAGIKSGGHMRSHRLRDTFAVDLLSKGVPMEEVSKLLGHESIKTTEKSYARWVKGRQDRLDTLVTNSWEPIEVEGS